MIPLNTAEAAILLKQREIEFKRGLKQIQHFGAMEKQWRDRNNRLAAEMDALRRHLGAGVEVVEVKA